MKATNKTLIAATLLLAALPEAQAQAQAEPLHERMAQMHRDIELRMERSMAPLARMQAFNIAPEALVFAGRELEGERLVKGAPYCATAVHETVQALMDGNRIVKQQSTQLCRDGEGRTRREIQREGGQRIVYLNDPVAKESWVLYPDKKQARRIGATLSLGSAPRAQMHLDMSERMREHAERWREWAGQVAQRARESGKAAEAAGAAAAAAAASASAAANARPGEPAIVVERVVETRGTGEPQRNREVRVIRLSDLPGAAPMPPLPPTPPALSFGWSGVSLPRSGGVTTALPAREIEGVKVDGERTTWTIEAGKIGNEKPIVSSREIWRSPELMLTVQSKDSDPRRGETNYRLEKIKRGEPDAALMKVPADYERSPVPKTPGAPKAPEAPRRVG